MPRAAWAGADRYLHRNERHSIPELAETLDALAAMEIGDLKAVGYIGPVNLHERQTYADVRRIADDVRWTTTRHGRLTLSFTDELSFAARTAHTELRNLLILFIVVPIHHRREGECEVIPLRRDTR